MEEKINIKDAPKLGFGFMRLPKKDDVIDIEETKKMVDAYMDAGLNYFDTAYVYDKGGSEKALKEALIDRYPRESFTIATKMNAWLGEPDEETTKKQFETSLERTGAGYFDYYLLHALQDKNYKLYEDYGLWDFVKEQKEKGLIKHYGFSYHSGPELLDELLTKHPDAEFVQLQINYQDWEDDTIAARANYEVARKHGKPVIIMEPVKGGKLAEPPKEILDLFESVDPDLSPASWALRYAASLDGILTVLSGMSNLEQMEDNLSFMKDFSPLDHQEQLTIQKAQEILGNLNSIPCTACHYCTENCPQNIPIPEIFKARNRQLLWGQTKEGQQEYDELVLNAPRASACIECGQCEDACPQSLAVISWLKDSSKHLD